jgi:putative cell wall-binding protein
MKRLLALGITGALIAATIVGGGGIAAAHEDHAHGVGISIRCDSIIQADGSSSGVGITAIAYWQTGREGDPSDDHLLVRWESPHKCQGSEIAITSFFIAFYLPDGLGGSRQIGSVDIAHGLSASDRNELKTGSCRVGASPGQIRKGVAAVTGDKFDSRHSPCTRKLDNLEYDDRNDYTARLLITLDPPGGTHLNEEPVQDDPFTVIIDAEYRADAFFAEADRLAEEADRRRAQRQQASQQQAEEQGPSRSSEVSEEAPRKDGGSGGEIVVSEHRTESAARDSGGGDPARVTRREHGGGPAGTAGSGSGTASGGGGSGGSGGVVLVVANGWSAADVGLAVSLTAGSGGSGSGGSALAFTRGERLSAAAGALLGDYEPASVLIVGGTAAVSAGTESAVRDAAPGSDLERVLGAGRVETSAAVARRVLGDPGRRDAAPVFVVANGWRPADIGVAAALAARTADAAVLYTGTGGLSDAAAAVLGDYGASRVLIVGGASAVGPDVETAVASAAPAAQIDRIGGATRTHTAALAARHVLGDPAASQRRVLIVANGWRPSDIGVAAALAARTANSAVVYTQDGRLSAHTLALLRDYQPGTVSIIGGPATITPAVRASIRSVLPDALISRTHGPTRTHTASLAARTILGRP